MIAAKVYSALKANTTLNGLVNGRIYRDFAGDSPTVPYVVWSILTAVPGGGMSRYSAYNDRFSVSVDVFANDQAQSDTMIAAARAAMETIGPVSSGPQSLGMDAQTRIWRYTFTTDVYVNR